ncbi:MAG TPA: hypothetical protein ENK49_09340 [Gammaproteobacteria bacterium]|nr:hypothetical protein [Gammaproteobacteria bacterium]
MNLSICKTLCNECPFSTSSKQGWLGPHTLDSMLDAQLNGTLFSCHLLRKQDMSAVDIESGQVRICRGFIASATKSGISFGQASEAEKALAGLQQQVAHEAKEDEEMILSRQEFEQYHGGDRPERKLSRQDLYRRLGYRF